MTRAKLESRILMHGRSGRFAPGDRMPRKTKKWLPGIITRMMSRAMFLSFQAWADRSYVEISAVRSAEFSVYAGKYPLT